MYLNRVLMRHVLIYFPGQCKVKKKNEKSRLSGKGRERISSTLDSVCKKTKENWILKEKKKG